MAVLKDAFCSNCENAKELMMETSQNIMWSFCPCCSETKLFKTRCTGGIKSRWRYMDWSGYNPRGCIETLETNVTHIDEHGNEVALPLAKGGTVNDWWNEHKAEREDKFRTEQAIKKGKQPLTFDCSKK